MSTTVVLMAYGTPRSRHEIEPYYTDIRRGRPPAPEQLADLVRRYDAIGGLSPLMARTEAQRAALTAALDARAPGRFEVRLGLKHASPRIEDAARRAVAAGAEQLVGLVLAPHYSALSVGQYLERLEASAGRTPVRPIRSWATLPEYVAFLAGEVSGRRPDGAHVLFTAHSLPSRVVDMGDPYPTELAATATAVAHAAGLADGMWATAWQSAGRTPEPWLGPDVLTAIGTLADAGATGVLVCPCGFVSDHLEVLYDLDVEATRRAAERGLAFARTRSMNDDPTVIGGLADLVVEAAR